MSTIRCKTFEEFILLALKDKSLLNHLIEIGNVLSDTQLEIDISFLVKTKVKIPLKQEFYLEGPHNRNKLVSLLIYTIRQILEEENTLYTLNDEFTICKLLEYKYIKDSGPDCCNKISRTPTCSKEYIFPYLP